MIDSELELSSSVVCRIVKSSQNCNAVEAQLAKNKLMSVEVELKSYLSKKQLVIYRLVNKLVK